MNSVRSTPSAPASSSRLPELLYPSQLQWSKVATVAVPLLLIVVAGIFIYAVRWSRSATKADDAIQPKEAADSIAGQPPSGQPQNVGAAQEGSSEPIAPNSLTGDLQGAFGRLPSDLQLRVKADLAKAAQALAQLQSDLRNQVEVYPTSGIPFKAVKKSHETAKQNFKDALKQFNLDSEVTYVKAEGLSLSGEMNTLISNSLAKKLKPEMFCWCPTQGVAEDILDASRQSEKIHLFCVASQYNATEATSPKTPKPGFAMIDSETDRTQGPACQRTNPRLFELVNGYLANGGFNMLAEVLDKETMGFLYHGYLCSKEKRTEKLIAACFIDKWSKMEQVCVSSHPYGGGSSPVYLMMAAAPCYQAGYSTIVDQDRVSKIQFYAAVANFTAQFNQVLHLGAQYPDKQIVYHAAGVGLGVFNNDPLIVGQAFKIAALHFQDKFPKNVQVQFDVLQRDGKLEPKVMSCVQSIGLQMKRIS